MLSLLLSSKFSKPLIIATAILLSLGLAYYKGSTDKQRQLELRALQAEIVAEKLRREIDDDTENLGDYDLCVELGGLSNECSELVRRMGKTTEAE